MVSHIYKFTSKWQSDYPHPRRVRIDKTTINLQLKVSRFLDPHVNKCSFLQQQSFILIHLRTSENINISFNNYYQTFAIEIIHIFYTSNIYHLVIIKNFETITNNVHYLVHNLKCASTTLNKLLNNGGLNEMSIPLLLFKALNHFNSHIFFILGIYHSTFFSISLWCFRFSVEGPQWK